MISIQENVDRPIYLQITYGLIQHIQSGVIKSATKIPGTRVLSQLLGVHRKTVVRAVEELEAQGWVDIIPYRGVFVVNDLPQRRFQKLKDKEKAPQPLVKAAYELPKRKFLTDPIYSNHRLVFSDGTPDVRLAPVHELATAYARYLRDPDPRATLNYGDARGPQRLREILAKEFNRDRGLHLTANNILITRGSQMAIFLAAQVLLRKDDTIMVGETSYFSANLCFRSLGAKLLTIPVDENGLCVEEIPRLIKKGKKIKALYLTSHHHHPTTVTLSPERRLYLLDLAARYGFAIIEDDYSYDFHYANSPILPLASADRNGHVIYIGSFSKSTAPAFRVGYFMAPEEVINEAMRHRRFIDRQGDTVMELAIADLLENGTIQRYRKKAIKQYRKRLDLFCERMKTGVLAAGTDFKRPDGGMAAWVKFDSRFPLPELSKKAAQKDLYLSSGLSYNPVGQSLNATRMGFASMGEGELLEGLDLLEGLLS